MPDQPTRIVLIDDHTLFRDSLVRLLETDSEFKVVARCATVNEGYRALQENVVDVVLLDYDLGDEIGTDLLARLGDFANPVRVIMVTAGMRSSAALGAVHTGVSGIVLKHSDPQHLIEAIRRVAKGEKWWDSGIVRALTTGGEGQTDMLTSPRSITERQRRVLRGILDGLTNKEIAGRMQASETSIKAIIQELFHKAAVRTRSQLVRVAIERYSTEWLTEEQGR